MTITPFEMYLLVKLNDIQGLFLGIGIIGCIVFSAGIILTIMTLAIEEETAERWRYLKILSAFLAASLLSVILGTLLPSTKQAAMIYVAPMVINSDLVQKDIPKEAAEIYGLAKQWLREQAGERPVGER